MPDNTPHDDARVKAEEAYEAEIEREVKVRVEAAARQTMDAEQAKAALAAAEAKNRELASRIESQDKRLERLESCASTQKDADEKARQRMEASTLERARFLARARVPAARVEEEAKRLANLGAAAVDELLRATPAPRSDPTALAFLRGEAGVKEEKDHLVAFAESDEEGNQTGTVGLMVRDWSHYKPQGRPVNPMGVQV